MGTCKKATTQAKTASPESVKPEQYRLIHASDRKNQSGWRLLSPQYECSLRLQATRVMHGPMEARNNRSENSKNRKYEARVVPTDTCMRRREAGWRLVSPLMQNQPLYVRQQI